MTDHMTDEATKPKRTRPDLVTGRTKPWGTKLKPEDVDRIADICHRDKIKANDFVERALKAYEREHEGVMVVFAHAFERADKAQRLEMGKVIGAWVTANKAELKGEG
jgi:hypothetical protein